MPPPRSLKTRIIETLDEINPLIMWYLRYFYGCYVFLVILGIGAIFACFGFLHYFHVDVFDSLAALEIFFWILSLCLSLLFLYPTLDCLSGQIKQDELYRLRTDTPLERLHCHMAVTLIPLVLAWLIPLPFILIPTFWGGSIFNYFSAVTILPLSFAGIAFVVLSQEMDMLVFRSKISISGFPSVMFVIGWFAVLVDSSPEPQAVTLFLSIALPAFCTVTYRLLRKNAIEGSANPGIGFVRNLLVYGILSGLLLLFRETIRTVLMR